MSAYDYDAPPRDREYSRRQYREERRDRDPRYLDAQDPYYRGSASSRNELVPRPREDSDLSVEEIRRDFPPPGYSRDIRRARSAEPGYDDYYYDSRRDYDARSTRDSPRERSSKKAGSVYYEEEEKTRKRVLSKQEKIVAAVLGGVLAAGAKEVWDRREANQEGHNGEVNRNLMASAALGAAGALAGYQGADFYNKHAEKENKKSTYIMHKGRDGRVQEYYSDEEEDPKSQKGNKNFIESALAAAGLGGAIKALTGGGDKDKDKDDSRSDTKSRRGGSPDSKKTDTPANRMQQAAKASLVAGAAEAFRVAREPGGWKGEKMKRVLTAAAGAATIDAAHDPSKDTKRHLLESVVGGLVGNRVINGSRKDIEEDKKTGRSRSRSRARSDGGGGGGATGLAALATAGLGAFGAKKLLDKRDESRGRGASPDSRDSRDGSPRRRQRSRSRSVVDTARRGLARLGIGNGPEEDRDDHDDSRSRRSRRTRSPDDRYEDDRYSSRNYDRGGGRDDYYDDDRSAKSGRRRSRSRQRGGRSGSASSSDLGDSEDDEKRAKKMRDGHRRRHHD